MERRQLAAQLALNPVTAHKALRELHQATVLDFQKVGNNFVYSLRDGHHLVRELLKPLFQREAQALGRLRELLRQGLNATLRRHVVSAAIYGSVATRHERPISDVDLLVLVTSARSKRNTHQALDQLGETVARTFGNPLTLYLNTVREARQKVRRGLPVFRNILRDHQLVWGRPLEEVLRGRAA